VARTSDGASAKFGTALIIPGWLTGEMAIGYLQHLSGFRFSDRLRRIARRLAALASDPADFGEIHRRHRGL
jgi:hypothetical protein